MIYSKEFKVKLLQIDTVKKFVELTIPSSCDIDIMVGRYIIDGKSILGIFSIDLTRVLSVKISGESEKVVSDLYDSIDALGIVEK